MHVLQLSDFYRPIVGGLERHVETLSLEMQKMGHTSTVVTLQTADDQPLEEEIEGVRVIRVRSWSSKLTSAYANAAKPFHPTAPDPGVVAALRRVVRDEQPDVVHSQGWMQYSYFPLHRTRSAPAHIITLHDYGLACPKKTLQYTGPTTTPVATPSLRQPATDITPVAMTARCSGPGLLKCLGCAPDQYGLVKGALVTAGLRASRPLHRRADRYIAISNAVASGSRAALPDPDNVAVVPTMVPNGLPELAASTPRPDFLPPENGYLMFVGALGPHKGIDVLLEARRRMHTKPPVVFIGTPRPDTPALDEPGVTVALNVPSAQVMAAWSRASIAVVPSVWDEPLGQVAVEASLVGRPVVASAVGGLQDVVEHNSTGLLVPPSDPTALAQALDALVADPQMRERFGEAGRQRARRFESAAVAPRVVEVFQEALDRRAAAASHQN